MAEGETVDPKVFGALNKLEQRFQEAEDELSRRQIQLYNPIYAERDPWLVQIPQFWITCISETDALAELFNMEDTKLLDSLKTLLVTRSEEHPRDFTITMEFDTNDFLEEESLKLVKKFTREQDADEYTSTPVSIKWQKDVTSQPEGGRPSFFKFFAWTGNGSDEFEQGEEVALVLADEVYCDALKIWTDSQQDYSDDDSDVGSEDIQSGDEEDDEVDEEAAAADEEDQPLKKKSRTE